MTHEQAVETLAAERYLLDEMSELERFRFEEHFFECDECAESLRLGHRLRSDANAIFAGLAAPPSVAPGAPDRPRRAASAPMTARLAVPWAAAAILAAGLAYQTFGGGGRGGDVYVLTAVELRPATRGAVPTVRVPAGDDAVLLALDLNAGAPGQAIAYTLAREDGAVVAEGRATAPPVGSPLYLSVPARRIAAGEGFVLTISVDGSTAPPSEYRFAAAR